MRRAQPPLGLSPSLINICKAYHGRSHDTPMVNFEEAEADEEDIDYEEEEEGEEDEDDEEDDEEAEEGGVDIIDMGSFSEPGRKFLSKVWKEYEPIRVDGIVVAAECKHCARNICAERKHGTSSLRKNFTRCKERKKVLRVSGQLSASIVGPGVPNGPTRPHNFLRMGRPMAPEIGFEAMGPGPRPDDDDENIMDDDDDDAKYVELENILNTANIVDDDDAF
ncbi:BED zinc finger family protein [Hordeum vulgare]|nr:BED zinc finger family protein [Hordeum vulgare]